MNKKGMTIVEIIVSIALISIVLVLLFQLLVDLKYEETLSSYKSKDAINRTEIIKAVQDDLTKSDLTRVLLTKNADHVKIDLTMSGEVKTIMVYSNYVTYNGERWTLNEPSVAYDFANSNVSFITTDESAYYLVKVYVPTTIKNDREVSLLYDLEFVYLNKKPADFNADNFK